MKSGNFTETLAKWKTLWFWNIENTSLGKSLENKQILGDVNVHSSEDVQTDRFIFMLQL